MNPQEKAQELVGKYIPHTRVFHEVLGWEDYLDSAKQCALIAVDEILEATKHEYQIQYESGEWSREIGYKYSEYWKQVRNEIEKL